MFSYLKGKIRGKGKDFVVLENQGIGFKIFVSEKNLKGVDISEEKEFFIFFAMRNDKPELYGFLDKEELKVFEIIESISGIGPKGALLISSLGSIDDLKQAVQEKNFSYFSKIKGIGRKKVQKILLELGGTLEDLKGGESKAKTKDSEALKGLLSLGFSRSEAQEALKSVPEEIKGTKERVQMALKFFSK